MPRLNGVELHHETYATERASTALPAQLLCGARVKATEALASYRVRARKGRKVSCPKSRRGMTPAPPRFALPKATPPWRALLVGSGYLCLFRPAMLGAWAALAPCPGPRRGVNCCPICLTNRRQPSFVPPQSGLRRLPLVPSRPAGEGPTPYAQEGSAGHRESSRASRGKPHAHSRGTSNQPHHWPAPSGDSRYGIRPQGHPSPV